MKNLMIILVVGLLTLVGCQTSKVTPPPEPEKKPDFQTSMHTFSGVLTDLLPKVIAKDGFDSNPNRAAVKADVDILANMAHNIDAQSTLPSQDPSLRMVSSQFKSELTDIQGLIASNNWSSAKTRLYQVTQYCIACHSMNTAQNSAFTANLYADAPNMTHYERARYKTAIRQFDSAIKEFEQALNDKEWAKAHPDEWENALMSILTLVTHVQKNPNLALEMISAFRDRGLMPEYLRASSLIWRQQAKAWDRDKKTVVNLATIEEWMGMAKKMTRPKYANVFLLVRSSAWLHEKLATGELQDQDLAKALYFQGLVGQDLKDLNYFVFPEPSLKLCIEKAGAASPLGRKCAKALAENSAH